MKFFFFDLNFGYLNLFVKKLFIYIYITNRDPSTRSVVPVQSQEKRDTSIKVCHHNNC